MKNFCYTVVLSLAIGGFISCGNSNNQSSDAITSSEEQNIENSQPASMSTENESDNSQKDKVEPTISGYWERISGGDYDPDIAAIFGFKDNGQIEKIALYDEGTDRSSGYREKNSGNYYFDGTNITAWGESYPVILSWNTLEFDGMKFQKITENDVKRRIANIKDFSEE